MRNEAALAVLGAAVPIASAYCLGLIACVRSSRLKALPRALQFAVGSSMLCLLLLTLMLLHLATTTALLVSCAVPVAVAGLSKRLTRLPKWTKPPLVPGILLGIYACLYLLAASSPELQTDALNYHLQPAIEVLRYDGFAPEINFYNRFPQGAEVLYIPAYLIGGPQACRLVHLTFLLATLPLILVLADRLSLSRNMGWIAAGLYFLSPVVGVTGTSAMNDCLLVFFCLSVTITALFFRNTPDSFLAFSLGLLAGMCYAIKMTGGVALLLGFAMVVRSKQRWTSSAFFALGALLLVAPWLIRNWIEVGNPFAPFFNAIFPNPFFYTYVEQSLNSDLRNYGVSWVRRLPEVLTGYRLQGLLGPIFVLAALPVFFLNRRSVRILLGLALLFSTAWWLNAGTRFLMPALPFVSLAIAAVLPRHLASAVLIVHAVLSWPPMIDLWSPLNWRIRDLSWQVAIGLQASEEYLREHSWDYHAAKVVEHATKPNGKILDLAGLHRAFIDRPLVGHWQSAEGFQARKALELTQTLDRNILYEVRTSFPSQLVRSVLIRQTASSPTPWSISDLAFWSGLQPFLPDQTWQMEASVNPWDLRKAFDANAVSRWSTWRTKQSDDYVKIMFLSPQRLSKITVLAPASDSSAEMMFVLERADGSTVSFPSTKHQAPELKLRVHTIDALKKLGIQYITVSTLNEGLGVLGQELVNHAASWDLKKIAQYQWIHVLELPGEASQH